MSAASGQKTICGIAALEGLGREPQVGVERARRAAVAPSARRRRGSPARSRRHAAALREARSATQRPARRSRARAPATSAAAPSPRRAARPTRRSPARGREPTSANAAFAQASANEMPYTPVTDAICISGVDAGLRVAEGRPRRVADVDRRAVQQPAAQQVGAGPGGAGEQRRGGAAKRRTSGA